MGQPAGTAGRRGRLTIIYRRKDGDYAAIDINGER